jgi:hypothetical protein
MFLGGYYYEAIQCTTQIEHTWKMGRDICVHRETTHPSTPIFFFIYRLQKNQKNTFFALIQTSGESEERRSRCIIESQVPQTPIVLHGSHLRVMVKRSAIRSPDARSWYRITKQNREDLIIVEVVFRFIEGCLVSSVF